MHINHINITTGHSFRSLRTNIDDRVLTLIAPWIKEIANTQRQYPLPISTLNHYSIIADTKNGGLIANVYGQIDEPLVTLAVAQRALPAPSLWSMLLEDFDHTEDLEQPSTPWCAIALLPTVAMNGGAPEWLDDFERYLAWAWVTRTSNFEIVR